MQVPNSMLSSRYTPVLAPGGPDRPGTVLRPRPVRKRAAAGLRRVLALLALGTLGIQAHAATTTTLVQSGMTVPLNGFITRGSATNPSTGAAVRHLWISDHLQGLCRIDPDLDAPGPHAVNPNTCTLGGPAVYDPQTNNVYVADDVANRDQNQGVVRLRFVPTGDGGHGAINTAQATSLGGTGSCNVGSNRPTAMAQGPDGNLYLVFQRNGNILRIVSPAAASVPSGNFQTIGQGADARRNFGLAWIGHDLYGLDGGALWQIVGGDRCFTPANGNQTCRGQTVLVEAALLLADWVVTSSTPR